MMQTQKNVNFSLGYITGLRSAKMKINSKIYGDKNYLKYKCISR